MERAVTIPSGQVELAATLHYPDDSACSPQTERVPLVVICHDFAGNRIGDGRLYVRAARYFSERGMMTLRFDFGGCGESTGDYGASGMDAWLEQTRHALDYALAIDLIDPQRIILLGHGLGGAVALAAAARDKRIRTLVLWASFVHPFYDVVRLAGRTVYEECEQSGEARWSGFRFQPAFFESLTRTQPYVDTRRFSGDVLLVHGMCDETAPADYGFLLQKAFWLRGEGRCDKETVAGAGHWFAEEGAAERAIAATADWLDELHAKKSDWHGWTI